MPHTSCQLCWRSIKVLLVRIFLGLRPRGTKLGVLLAHWHNWPSEPQHFLVLLQHSTVDLLWAYRSEGQRNEYENCGLQKVKLFFGENQGKTWNKTTVLPVNKTLKNLGFWDGMANPQSAVTGETHVPVKLIFCFLFRRTAGYEITLVGEGESTISTGISWCRVQISQLLLLLSHFPFGV